MHHNHEMLKNFKIYDYIDHEVARKDPLKAERRFGLYPSDSSVIATVNNYKVVYGSCHRAIWYREKKVKVTNPISSRGYYIFAMGNIVEDFIVGKLKEAGLWKTNSKKFWLSEYSISGEIDILIRHPSDSSKYILVELKTADGYYAEKQILGTRTATGAPKPEHILQLCTYLYNFKDNPDIVGGKLIYQFRGNGKRCEFDVHLEERAGKYYICVNGEELEEYIFDDIIDRFKTLLEVLKLDIPPEKDYSILYSDDEMRIACETKQITDKQYKDFVKNPIKSNRKGHWRCSYCQWKNECYGLGSKDATQLEEEETEVD